MTGPEWASRFLAKVHTDGPTPDVRPELGPCHVWTASLDVRGGYGQFRLGGRIRKAHQLALELAGVEIPAGHEVDHLCRNHACVRPEHLEPVVRRENFLRGNHPTAVSVRTNRCQSNRHDLTEDNTIRRTAAKRECRACDNEGQRRRHAARKVGA
jgi:hypothetical protein